MNKITSPCISPVAIKTLKESDYYSYLVLYDNIIIDFIQTHDEIQFRRGVLTALEMYDAEIIEISQKDLLTIKNLVKDLSINLPKEKIYCLKDFEMILE